MVTVSVMTILVVTHLLAAVHIPPPYISLRHTKSEDLSFSNDGMSQTDFGTHDH